jgi:phenylpyruvate tautomerase PptA (4-oxalocrotonate tautomerase family)
MPIVTVDLVVESGIALDQDLAQSLADGIGRALKSPSGQTWVRLRSLGRSDYAENESLLGADELPVFVTVLKRQLPLGAELGGEVAALTQAIAQIVRRPVACVHVEYAPAAAGRVSFGGKLVE